MKMTPFELGAIEETGLFKVQRTQLFGKLYAWVTDREGHIVLEPIEFEGE